MTTSTKSVAVEPSGSLPVNLNPTTFGINMEIGWPNIDASASIPPTPQPNTPTPLIIVVCESVPTTESGYACVAFACSLEKITRARYSKFTW